MIASELSVLDSYGDANDDGAGGVLLAVVLANQSTHHLMLTSKIASIEIKEDSV